MPVISEQLKPIDTVNGFQIRPGFFREFGAVAIPGGVNFTIHTHGATSCELLLDSVLIKTKSCWILMRAPSPDRVSGGM